MHFGIFATTFGLIFLAELPDKTAYTVLLLASRGRPLPVLFGSWAAFLVQGLLAVALGSFIGQLPPQAVRWTTAALFLAFGLFLLLGKDAEEAPPPLSRRKAVVQAFVLVFLAELGDATQIGTAALVARLHDRWSVLAGSTLALWTVAALAVTLGATVGARLPKRGLRRVAGAVFLLFSAVSFLAR